MRLSYFVAVVMQTCFNGWLAFSSPATRSQIFFKKKNFITKAKKWNNSRSFSSSSSLLSNKGRLLGWLRRNDRLDIWAIWKTSLKDDYQQYGLNFSLRVYPYRPNIHLHFHTHGHTHIHLHTLRSTHTTPLPTYYSTSHAHQCSHPHSLTPMMPL